MRIRFRASDLVWSHSKDHSCKIEAGFLCGDAAGVIQRLGFWTQKIEASVVYTATCGAAPSALRSALDSSIQAYAQTLVWPRRDVPRRFTCYFFPTKRASPARRAAALCVPSYYMILVRSHERRAFLFSRSEPASTDSYSCSLAAVRRGDCIRASWLYS